MNFYSDLGEPNFLRDLLVHQARNHESHHFLLALAERPKAAMQIVCALLVTSPCAIAAKRRPDGIQNLLFPKRLGQEIRCAASYSFDRHRDITVAGDKDYWNIDLTLGLKLEPTHSG